MRTKRKCDSTVAAKYLEVILGVVCTVCKVEKDPILDSKTGKARITLARRLSMYFYYTYIPGATLAAIGQEFGDRNHSTVIHALRRIQELISTYDEEKLIYAECNKKIREVLGLSDS